MKALLQNDLLNVKTTDTTRAWTPFRSWVYHLWQANCDEHSQFHEPGWAVRDYWNNYKYWLKQEYRKQL